VVSLVDIPSEEKAHGATDEDVRHPMPLGTQPRCRYGAGQCVGRDGHRNVIFILVSKHSCHGERGGRMTGREGIAAFPKTAVVIMARRSLTVGSLLNGENDDLRVCQGL